MRHLVAEIAAFLGEPAPYEARRRFLVEYPDTALLDALPDCYQEEIEQIFLHAPENEEIRIRRRACAGDCVFYITRKRIINGRRRLEAEGRLTEREYMQFAGNADSDKIPVHKTRYSLNWKNHFYEIDLYPFWKDRAIMEIELERENEVPEIPDWVKIIRDVSADKAYKNRHLARRVPMEAI